MYYKKNGEPRKKPGATTLTHKREEIGMLNTDLIGLDALINKFTEDEWQQITSKYPNAHKNVVVLNSATELALEKMER